MAKQALTASTSTNIVEGGKDGTVSLDRDSGGIDQERAAQILYNIVPPGVIKFGDVEPGYATIRVFNSSNLSPILYISSSYSDKRYERLGNRIEYDIVESVSFSGSSEVSLSKGYAIYGGVSVLTATPFLNADGGNVSVPSYKDGKFTTNAKAYGTLIVQYSAKYTAYRVYYGLPDWVITRIFVNGESKENFTIPPLVVMAYDEGRSATAQIERKISDNRPAQCKNNEWVTDPGSSKIVKYKIYTESQLDEYGNPKANADFLTSVTYLKHVEYCKDEPTRKRAQEFPMPSANNIEVISVEYGSL
jgi:hypothetical protein